MATFSPDGTCGAQKDNEASNGKHETSVFAIDNENGSAENKTEKKENEIKHLIQSLKGKKTVDEETSTNIAAESQCTDIQKGLGLNESSSVSLELIHGQNDRHDDKSQITMEALETRKEKNPDDAKASVQDRPLVQNEGKTEVESGTIDKSNTCINDTNMPRNLTTESANTNFEITENDFVSTEPAKTDDNNVKKQTHQTTLKANPVATNAPDQEHELAYNGEASGYCSSSLPLELVIDKQDDDRKKAQSVINKNKTNYSEETFEKEVNLDQDRNKTDNRKSGCINKSTKISPKSGIIDKNTGFEIRESSPVSRELYMDSEIGKDAKKRIDHSNVKTDSLYQNATVEEQVLVDNENKSNDVDGGTSEHSLTITTQILEFEAGKASSVSFRKSINDQYDSKNQSNQDINTTSTQTNSFETVIPSEQVVNLFQNIDNDNSTIFTATRPKSNPIKERSHSLKKSPSKKLPQCAAALSEMTKLNKPFKMEQSSKRHTSHDRGNRYCSDHNILVGYWCKHCKAAKCEKCVNVAYSKRCVSHDVITMNKYVQETKKIQNAKTEKNSKDCLTELERSKSVFQQNEKQTQLRALYQRERIRQEFVSFYDLLNTAEYQILDNLQKAVEEYTAQYKIMEKTYGSLVEEEAHLLTESLRKSDDPFGYNLPDVDKWIDSEWRKLKNKIHNLTASVQPVPRIVQHDFVLRKQKTNLSITFSSVVEPCEIIQTVSTLFLEEESMSFPIRICDLFSCTNSLYCSANLILEIQIRCRGKVEFKKKMKYEDYIFNYGGKHHLQDNQQYVVRAKPLSMSDEPLPFNSKCKHVLIVTGQNTFPVKANITGYLEDVRTRHVVPQSVHQNRKFVHNNYSIIWPFSSFDGKKEFYDFSPEELRCIAYQADMSIYMTCHSRLWNDKYTQMYGSYYQRQISYFSLSGTRRCEYVLNWSNNSFPCFMCYKPFGYASGFIAHKTWKTIV